jgi:hypothetical protein
MKHRLKEEIREKDPTTVILFLLDNSVYYGRLEDGSNVAARKHSDGIYHIEGEVALCGRETLLHHFNTLKPVLDQIGRKRGILVAPMPRYIVAGCCSNPGHCSNRRNQDFEQQQQQHLEIVKKNLKDYLFYNGYRGVRVLDPCMDLRSLGLDDAWEADPVHPSRLAYNKIAAACAKINDRMRSQEQEAKRRRESFGDGGSSLPDARRGRIDHEASPRLQRGGQHSGGNRRGRGRGGGRWAGTEY